MNPKQTQSLLWQILGKPEKPKTRQGLNAKGANIDEASGAYWFGRKSGGSEAGEDDQKDEDGGSGSDDGEGGGRGGDPRKDPTETPEPGEEIPGLTGLHDCQSGRCVNVNFTMPAMPPEGWTDACTPPVSDTPPEYIWSVTTYDTVSGSRKTAYAESFAEIKAAAVSAVSSLTGSYAQETHESFIKRNEGHLFIFEDAAADMLKYVNDYGGIGSRTGTSSYSVSVWRVYISNKDWGFKDRWHRGEIGYSFGRLQRGSAEYAEGWADIQAKSTWPPETCAEIESTQSGFSPACEDKDPNLPPALKGEYSGFELCDKNGNPVQIERHGRGWIYRTTEYEVEINETGTVMRVRPIA